MLSCPPYGNNPQAVGFDKLDVDTERERLRKLIVSLLCEVQRNLKLLPGLEEIPLVEVSLASLNSLIPLCFKSFLWPIHAKVQCGRYRDCQNFEEEKDLGTSLFGLHFLMTLFDGDRIQITILDKKAG